MVVAGSNESLLNFDSIVILKVISHLKIKKGYSITRVCVCVYIYIYI
jgi:hypothetical protein